MRALVCADADDDAVVCSWQRSGREGGEESGGPQLVRRKVTVSEDDDDQVSIVLTRGGVRPRQILSWDQDNHTM